MANMKPAKVQKLAPKPDIERTFVFVFIYIYVYFDQISISVCFDFLQTHFHVSYLHLFPVQLPEHIMTTTAAHM